MLVVLVFSVSFVALNGSRNWSNHYLVLSVTNQINEFWNTETGQFLIWEVNNCMSKHFSGFQWPLNSRF